MAVANMPCAHGGYLKNTNCRVACSRRREYCALNAVNGTVDVASNECRREGCSEMPSDGANGSKAIVPVASEGSCLRAGCLRPRSGGLGATENGELCLAHATGRKVTTTTKHCRQEGCFTIPSYGAAGSTKRE